MKKTFEMDFYGRKIIIENGEVAKQADGAVLVRYGDTVVLSVAVVSDNVNVLADFFPLTVLYQEKLYSVGKIPGGFIKREGRPTENATLAARMIDRPMRPLFPAGFKNEVQIINTVLSVDPDNSPEMAALFGSSLATSISKIPFDGPVASVKVGRVNGEFVINPTTEQSEVSDIDLTVAGTYDSINMVESSAKQVKEEDMLEALQFGHRAVQELTKFQNEIIKEIGLEKMEYETLEINNDLKEEVKALATKGIYDGLKVKGKLESKKAVDEAKENAINTLLEKYSDLTKEEIDLLTTKIKLILEDIEYVLSTLDIRLIDWSTQFSSDKKYAKYVANVGADWWVDKGASWKPDWSANRDVCVGQFRTIEEEWKTLYMCSVPPELFDTVLKDTSFLKEDNYEENS